MRLSIVDAGGLPAILRCEMSRLLARSMVAFAAVVAVLLAVAVVLVLRQPLPAPPPLPNPNGFDDFIKAGGLLAANTGDYPDLGEPELRALVAKNAEALRLARIGLGHECRVPVSYSPVTTNTAWLNNLPLLKRLAQAFVAEGRLAELEGRPDDAAESYLAAVRLGCESSRGGLLINGLVGIAIDAMATAQLEKLVPRLDAKQCRAAVLALEAADSRWPSMQTILQQEQTWSRRTFGLKYYYYHLVEFKSQRQVQQRAMSRFNSQRGRSRHLMLSLAARAYELEQGTRPKSYADLVPAYLKAVPQDPLTGTNLAF